MANLPADPREFRHVFRKHAPFVWRVLRRHGVREADLEDACQEVFMVVHRRANDPRQGGSLRTWLYGIAMRVAASHRRRAHVRRETLPGTLPEVPSEPNQLLALERRDARHTLQRALDQLPETKREVFLLYEVEDLPMAEVAEVVGCPVNTAYARLAAARRAIEAHVRRERTVAAARYNARVALCKEPTPRHPSTTIRHVGTPVPG